ncbi:DUF5615 family PIN-like protein [Sphaerotilus mobilis]|uniref:Putative nuclease of predicted toxin-antitoxin system n=1 Tax=Sphaerotilus mobilis TaxID=47994 RepID=A0A4Q7LMC5_9BURK|nr:DUF5615 family PIN-like protein [Sphaerotilus mobilis]RZS54749.1 putative nuclease of predicted toxin-antitoxin system [Sphaerotilus mobilis]
MKLLLDENLSHRLVPALQLDYPGSTQVTLAGLGAADDRAVWRYAAESGFVLVTKDDDFLDLAAHHGAPPVVIRLVLGNCRNEQVLAVLHAHRQAIQDMVDCGDVGVIELG